MRDRLGIPRVDRSIVYLEVKLGGQRVSDSWPAETSKSQSQNSRFSSQQQQTTWNNKRQTNQSRGHSRFALANLALVRLVPCLLTVPRSSSSRPGQLRNKAKRQSSNVHHSLRQHMHFFGGERQSRPPLPEIIRSSYPHLG